MSAISFLSLLDFSNSFILEIDASDFGISSVFSIVQAISLHYQVFNSASNSEIEVLLGT